MYPIVLHELDLNDAHKPDINPKYPHKLWISPDQITAVRTRQTQYIDLVDDKWVTRNIMHGSVDIDGVEVAVRETLQQICLAILSAARKEGVENYDLNSNISKMKLKKVVLDMDLYYADFFHITNPDPYKENEESDNNCKVSGNESKESDDSCKASGNN
jgi:hypothetical protein